jgi:type IV secretory pathway TrbL component
VVVGSSTSSRVLAAETVCQESIKQCLVILAGFAKYKIHMQMYIDHAGARIVAVTLQHQRSSVACIVVLVSLVCTSVLWLLCMYAVVLMLVVCRRDACLLRIHRMPEEFVVVVALPSHIIP